MIKRFTVFLHLFFLIFSATNLTASLNFYNRNAYIYPYTYNSGIKITNKNSVSGYKKQDIIKQSQAKNLFMQNISPLWQANSVYYIPRDNFELVSYLYTGDNQTLEFSSNVVVDGHGNDLILGRYSQLLIDEGVTVTFKNMIIRNTFNTNSIPPINCLGGASKLCLDNVKFELGNDFVFSTGQIFIYNDVEFTGTSKFSYRSTRQFYITSHSNLKFSPNTTFEYYPASADNSLIKMADETSAIIFDGSTLQTTHTGLRFTKGSLYFDNRVTLSSALATYPPQAFSNGIIFGNSTLGSTYDVDLYLLGNAKMSLYGKVWYDDVN